MNAIEKIKNALYSGDTQSFFKILDEWYENTTQENTPDKDIFYSESEAMTFMKVSSKTTMWHYRTKLELPYFQIGRIILYRKSDLVAFIEKHKVA